MWFFGLLFGVGGYFIHSLLIVALIAFLINRTILKRWKKDIEIINSYYSKLILETSLLIKYLQKRFNLLRKKLVNYVYLNKIKNQKTVNSIHIHRNKISLMK